MDKRIIENMNKNRFHGGKTFENSTVGLNKLI